MTHPATSVHDAKRSLETLQGDPFFLFQSQQSHPFSSQAQNHLSNHAQDRIIPLFSKRSSYNPSSQETAQLAPSKESLKGRFLKSIPKEIHPSNVRNKQLMNDPNFQYRSISEVPERYRTLFSKFPHFNKVQSKVFDDVLYTDNPVVLSSPTGSGKTVVFELAIVRTLIQTPAKDIPKIKIVYMAPLKALCAERLSDWNQKFSPYNIKCLEVTGDSDIDDYNAIKSTNLIFTTPEKWDSVTRKWKEHVSQMEHIMLFLIDEVHMVGDSERGSTIEAVVSRMKCIKDVTKSPLRFIAVSATIPNPEDFASWLSSSEMNSVCFKLDESYRPVPLQKVVLSFGDCTPSTAFKFDLNLNYKLHNIIQQYSSKCPTIVFCSTRKSTVQAASTLQSQKRFVFNESERLHIRDAIGNVVDSKLRELLVCGVGYHHAGLSPSDRKVVEDLFIDGFLPVICATSTLAMGVNLPAHLVIVKSTIHYAGGKFREYSSADVLQMIGRAGRPQFDTSAVAVIMTQNCTKNLYSNLVSGVQVIESNIHHNLTEHLNSEIVLKTLTHVKVATQWMTSLFLFVRISKNPTRYGLPEKVQLPQIKEFLQNAVMSGINSLKALNFISLLPDGTISPTESGSLMARYCINFNTMKTFSEMRGDESLNDLIDIIAASHEFSDIQLRVREKSVLNLLNKNKNGPVVRYPFKDKIKTSGMKTSVLLQSVLGCIPISDFSLNQESVRIVQVASRVSKCLLEFQSQIPSFQCYVNCLLLMKCLNCKLWENTKFVARQFKNVGPMLSNLLANAGIVGLQKLISTDARELELITNKNPPFGTNLVEQASVLPQYDLFVQQTGDIDNCKASLQVIIKPKQSKEPAFNSSTSLIIGTPENVLIYKHKLKDKIIFEDGSFQCEVNVYRTNESQSVIFWLINHSYVGSDIKSKFSPKFVGDLSVQQEQNDNKPIPSRAPISKQTKIVSNPYKQQYNPYANQKVSHNLKMDQKLSDSSRIVVGKKMINNEAVSQKISKFPVDAGLEDSSDFDDLPEIDWSIEEIIEPPVPRCNTINPPQLQNDVKLQQHSTISVKGQVVKPILKGSNSRVSEVKSNKNDEDLIDVLMQEMEDSGYFEDFEKNKQFDVGVDDLLGGSENATSTPTKYLDQLQNSRFANLVAAPTKLAISDDPSCKPLPLTNLADENSACKSVSEKHELDSKVIRIDENGDQYRECGHKCADKTSCSHFCCRYGVKVKPPSKRAASTSIDPPLAKKGKQPSTKSHDFFSDPSYSVYKSRTESFRLQSKAYDYSTSSLKKNNDSSTTAGSYYNATFQNKDNEKPVGLTKAIVKPIQISNSSYKCNSIAIADKSIKHDQDFSAASRTYPGVVHSTYPRNISSIKVTSDKPVVNDGDSSSSFNVCQLKQNYVERFSKFKETETSVATNFEATQPPRFQTNIGFYDSKDSKSSSSSFSSIFDGIL